MVSSTCLCVFCLVVLYAIEDGVLVLLTMIVELPIYSISRLFGILVFCSSVVGYMEAMIVLSCW